MSIFDAKQQTKQTTNETALCVLSILIKIEGEKKKHVVRVLNKKRTAHHRAELFQSVIGWGCMSVAVLMHFLRVETQHTQEHKNKWQEL